jgi:hypothetical protein
MAKATKKAAAKKGSGKRELIEPRSGDKRYVRRDAEGQFSESDDVGRSLSQDRKRTAKTEAKPGYGDRGDQKKRTASKKGASKKGATKKAASKKSASKKSGAKK